MYLSSWLPALARLLPAQPGKKIKKKFNGYLGTFHDWLLITYVGHSDNPNCLIPRIFMIEHMLELEEGLNVFYSIEMIMKLIHVYQWRSIAQRHCGTGKNTLILNKFLGVNTKIEPKNRHGIVCKNLSPAAFVDLSSCNCNSSSRLGVHSFRFSLNFHGPHIRHVRKRHCYT